MSAPRDEGAPQPASRRRLMIAFLPLVLFIALSGVFLYQLGSGKNASEIPSVLIGSKAPSLDLAPLEGLVENGQAVPALTDAAIAGKLSLVNVWASWCVPCRQEHPILLELARDPRVTLVGINYKDKTENALKFLDELGNPFTAVGIDPNGKAAIDWGVYGVPETYLVAPDGEILFKQIGPFTVDALRDKLLPAIEKAVSPPA
ncbi:MAG: DsbE family thiol:disulfide interchange protein [Hoeflea sp.]|uniref:DsbE family thiol:disulfide interchange protein n=1 Tax=Hoeflea sp. TaxID=1940281 RepID=UPI001D720210|nr:DsbE family thiol:disulfide interchange protein [Hoeflea sp.]MBU4529807.1 DsbE family thiol:disulfide interchange protein [Alphaproteobacteria bacterium]MBU4547172.1 DsbE family thiol:disulfide interchange protein [Alphaproteobacteria bacterium]MBU4548785.1 DsbE family thiol:disulfide interchange protein [Alphaproteobacteria bacterium]MBV1722299.1 DsbE family thiol:disulfide interchange protein [Hoeflea sp.]MBV1762544.1 DsbE family thiol:disulfide interchange protein [Hoeflea sp.]